MWNFGLSYSKFYNLVVFVLFVCIIDDVCLGIDIFHCKSKWSISELWIMYSITPRAMTSLCWFLIFYSFSSHLAGGQGRSSRPTYLNSYELNNQIFISWLGTWIKNVWIDHHKPVQINQKSSYFYLIYFSLSS